MRGLALLIVAMLAGCTPKPAAQPASGAGGLTSVAVAKGVVEAQGGLVRVLTPREGRIERAFAEEGDTVRLDQGLVQLDSRQQHLMLEIASADVAETRARLAAAIARAGAASREALRLKALSTADAATRQEADQAATAAVVSRSEQQQLEQALRAAEARRKLAAYEVEVRAVRAPIAGRVVRRTAISGAFAAAATPLFVIEPMGARLVRAELDEAFSDQVRPGMHAVVTREFQSGRSYDARVLRVSDVLAGPALVEDAVSRADARVVGVVLALPPTADLRLGQRVLVRFRP